MIPPIDETFAGNSWRVKICPERPATQRFAVMAMSPTTFGREVEICAVSYLPHAMAIAALPEMASAVMAGAGVTLKVGSVLAVGDKCETAIIKATDINEATGH